MVVGLTGGIGSGKTTVAGIFNTLGVPIYVADTEAKNIMSNSVEIKNALIKLFGEKAYHKGLLNREYLSSKIFENKELLQKMNNIVHPAVKQHFKNWLKEQKSSYVIKEAAIIFEHGKQAEYDYVITVVADVEKRVERTMKRDSKSRKSIENIMDNQLLDDEKVKLSDFVIRNDDLRETKSQVLKIHEILLERAAKKY